MKYDFDILVDRENIGSEKTIDTPKAVNMANAVPFFYAEMDFKTAPVVVDAIMGRAKTGYYAAALPDDAFLDAIIKWIRERRCWNIEKNWIVPTGGTVASICTAIQAFTEPGDGIIRQPPVFQAFRNRSLANNRIVLDNPLIYENGFYRMDFAQLEKLTTDPKAKMLLLCNPHSPVGRVWTKDELETLAKIVKKNNIIVFSDESFAETAYEPNFTTCFASIEDAKDNCIVSTSLNKNFSIQGIKHANLIIPSEAIRERFLKRLDANYFCDMEGFIYPILIAAYENGGDWLDAMKEYVAENLRLVTDFMNKHLPQVKVIQPEFMYFAWIDWRGLGMDEDELHRFLIEEAAFAIDRGSEYGKEGDCFGRMVLTVPRPEIARGLERLFKAVQKKGF